MLRLWGRGLRAAGRPGWLGLGGVAVLMCVHLTTRHLLQSHTIFVFRYAWVQEAAAEVGAPAPAKPPSNPPSPGQAPGSALDAIERMLELSLVDAVRLAVEHNLDIERERFGPRIARTDVEAERSAFDPVVGLEASISQTKTLPTTETRNVDGQTSRVITPFSKNGEITPLFKQKIITGGNYELRFVNTRQNVAPAASASGITRSIADPRYESSLDLTIVQPLLRDFGIAVNTAPIRRAQNSEAIAQHRVMQAILDVVFEVQEGYWDLVFRLQDLQANRESQKLAEDFLAENKIRVELGTLAPIELVQAETQVKIREEDVIVAESAVRESEDALKEILNIPETLGTWRIRVRPTDRPTFEPVSTLLVEDKVEQALRLRPDILESRLTIDSRKIAREEARNQRLPRLDLEARGRVNAFGDSAGESLSDIRDATGYRWSFGLQFEYPLGNRSARNALLRREFELQQAWVEQRDIQLTIVREIRQAIRGIETAIKRVEVTRAATKLAQTQLDAEQEKFRLGLSTSFRVLEFQRDLTDARSAETQALTDYNVELARLDLRTGMLRYVDTQANTDAARRDAPNLAGGPHGRPHEASGAVAPSPWPLAAKMRVPDLIPDRVHTMQHPRATAKIYTIQVGAYLVEAHARRIMIELRDKGYNPYMVAERDTRNRLWRKICFGHYTSKTRAHAMEAAFQAQENRNALVILTERESSKHAGEGG